MRQLSSAKRIELIFLTFFNKISESSSNLTQILSISLVGLEGGEEGVKNLIGS